MEREMPKAGEVWRHFKGNCYLVIAANGGNVCGL